MINIKEYKENNNLVSSSWNAIIAHIIENVFNNGGGCIFFPTDTYTFTQTLNVAVPLHLLGDGQANTILDFDAQVAGSEINVGIHIQSGGTGTVLEYLLIRGHKEEEENTSLPVSRNGVILEAAATLKDIKVEHFHNDGIHINITAMNIASHWHLSSVASYSNGRHGLYNTSTVGNGVGIALDMVINGGVGVLEVATLGSTYIGCHTLSNATCYKATNDSVFIGCYNEGDQDRPYMGEEAIWLAGHGGVARGDGAIIRGTSFRIQENSKGIRFQNEKVADNVVDFTAAGAAEGVIFEFGAENDFRLFNTGDNPPSADKTLQDLTEQYQALQAVLGEQGKIATRLQETHDSREQNQLNQELAQLVKQRVVIRAQINVLETSYEKKNGDEIPVPESVVHDRWRLRLDPMASTSYNHWYRLAYGTLADKQEAALAFSSNFAADNDPRVERGSIAFPKGFYMGKNIAIKVGVSDTMPNWEGRKGDRVFNTSINSTDENPIAGWICLGGEQWRAYRTG
ncbi:MAG: hypothetical protein ACPGXL_07325 [Chitinophagales bacterium]